MFGDAGHGLLMIGVAAALRAGWPRWLAGSAPPGRSSAGPAWRRPSSACCTASSSGRPGSSRSIWLNPLSHPVDAAARRRGGIGAVLLAGAYTLGAVNRWREGGWRSVLYAPSGIAGSCALPRRRRWPSADGTSHQALLLAAGGVAAAGRAGAGLRRLPRGGGGGGTGVVQAPVEVVDLVVRLGSNVVSFTRLAAFGLTHAALGLLVWEGTRGAVAPGRCAVRRRGRRVRARDRAGVQPGGAGRGASRPCAWSTTSCSRGSS